MEIQLNGLNTLIATFAATEKRAGAAVVAVVRKTAADTIRDAKTFSPVDTGNLRASIGADIDGDGRQGSITARVGPTANYGRFVEEGTSRMAPQAFIGPAFDRNSAAFVEALKQSQKALL